jgi:hypothetical protein
MAEKAACTAILVSDAACKRCGGPVELFLVPDKVWKALGLDGWVCPSCVASALKPGLGARDLGQEIRAQRKRFELKRFNWYCGAHLEHTGVIIARDAGVGPAMTRAQVMGGNDNGMAVEVR